MDTENNFLTLHHKGRNFEVLGWGESQRHGPELRVRVTHSAGSPAIVVIPLSAFMRLTDRTLFEPRNCFNLEVWLRSYPEKFMPQDELYEWLRDHEHRLTPGG